MNTKHDVIIIGAGVGGLVCGCYLAKAGMKVLIIEKQSQPGGCCTSFYRKGFTFDSGVHYLGSCREGGIISGILEDFAINKRITLLRGKQTEKFLFPGHTINFWADTNRTRQELISHFPDERSNINSFFKFINTMDLINLVVKTQGLTFKEFLCQFFKNQRLKSILSCPLANLALSPSEASALSAIQLYREYILDGGYYPRGGIQEFPNLLAKRFNEYGGNILLSTGAKKILASRHRVKGVQVSSGQIFYSNYVISNADAIDTFKKMIDFKTEEASITSKLCVSSSAFSVHLGLNSILRNFDNQCVTWIFFTYDMDRCFNNNVKNSRKSEKPSIDYIACHFPTSIDNTLAPCNKSIIRLMLWKKYDSSLWWSTHKQILFARLSKKIGYLIPDLDRHIEIKEIATPVTYRNYTGNHNGAAFGWKSTVSQVKKSVFPSESSIKGLYTVGHWTTTGLGQSGIPMVALCGRYVSREVLRDKRLN